MSRYYCEECNQKFKTIIGLTNHLIDVHKVPCMRIQGKGRRDGGAYFCCDYQFRDRIHWLFHIGDKHGVAVTFQRGIVKRTYYADGVQFKSIIEQRWEKVKP